MSNSTSSALSTAESSPGSLSASSNGSPATNQLDLPLNIPSDTLNVLSNQWYISAEDEEEYPDEDEDDDEPPPDAEGRGPIVPPTMGGTGKQTQRPIVRQPTSPPKLPVVPMGGAVNGVRSAPQPPVSSSTAMKKPTESLKAAVKSTNNSKRK